MRPETYFTDQRGRIYATPEDAACGDISDLLNIPAGVAKRIIARFGQIDEIITDMSKAEAAHDGVLRDRGATVFQLAPRRKTAIPAACRANQGE